MKKIFLLAFVLWFGTCHSQTDTISQTVNKSEGAVTIGYGVPAIFKKLLESDLRESNTVMKSNAVRYGYSFSYATGGFGPLFIKWDHRLGNKIGLGVVIGFFTAWASETYTYKRTYTRNTPEEYTQTVSRYANSASIGGRLNYHFIRDEKTDLYIGFGVGYTHALIETRYSTTDPYYRLPDSYTESQPIPVYLSATFGVRHYLIENIGVYFEIGFDKWALLQAGLAFKIK